MARKRASMREGPLADLFRSTEESVSDEEIRVTATGSPANGRRAEVATAEPQPAPEPGTGERPTVEPQTGEKPAAEPQTGKQPAVEPQTGEQPAEPHTGEQPAAEPDTGEQRVVEPQARLETQPASDPGVEVEIHETHEHRVIEQPARQHEGLERLIGGGEPKDERPAFGRDEPSTSRYATLPRSHQAVLRVVGVGGAGVNAVNRMVEAQVPGVEFVAINTDLQSLQTSGADVTLHIGAELTRGLGSGSDPRVGYRAAFEEQDKIKSLLKGSDMVFLAAGAGGGTGTGAAPVVAKLARDIGALTVAAVTKPFGFEGARRAAQAEEGIAALGGEVDTLIAVPNERLLQILERRTSITDAFRVADDVLRQAVQGISDLVMLPGLINLDFADVRTTMIDAGDAILGIGMGVGEHRATLAAEKAVCSPLLDTSVEGAHSLLLSITGGPDLSLIEASEAAEVVRGAAHPDANIIFGASVDEDMLEEVWVTVIATRFESAFAHRHRRDRDHDDDPRRPWTRDRSIDRDERDGRGLDVGRYAEPGGDWRGEGTGAPWSEGRGRDHRPAEPGTGTRGGLVLDVPEFIPGH
jgi:cell division protein FtsZ